MKRIKISDTEFNALSRLCDHAGCDWFYNEYRNRKTVNRDDVECLFAHWIPENINRLSAAEKTLLINLFRTVGLNP